MADQLIAYCALGDGVGEYTIPRMTEHVETNFWLAEEMLGARTKLEGNRVRIDGVGYHAPLR